VVAKIFFHNLKVIFLRRITKIKKRISTKYYIVKLELNGGLYEIKQKKCLRIKILLKLELIINIVKRRNF
jgi:hypothetical protein